MGAAADRAARRTVICGNQRLLAAQRAGLGDDPGRHGRPRRGASPAMGAPRQQQLRRVGRAGARGAARRARRSRGSSLALTGFSGGELDRILAGITAPADPDDAPDAPAGSRSRKPGEIYELGPHRLPAAMPATATSLQRLLGDERAEVFWTDPPYGVDYVGKTARRADGSRTTTRDGLAALLAGGARGRRRAARRRRRGSTSPPRPARTGTEFRLALAQVGWRHHRRSSG